jgi:hypothetical protein
MRSLQPPHSGRRAAGDRSGMLASWFIVLPADGAHNPLDWRRLAYFRIGDGLGYPAV